jgi:hypothetical protein
VPSPVRPDSSSSRMKAIPQRFVRRRRRPFIVSLDVSLAQENVQIRCVNAVDDCDVVDEGVEYVCFARPCMAVGSGWTWGWVSLAVGSGWVWFGCRWLFVFGCLLFPSCTF